MQPRNRNVGLRMKVRNVCKSIEQLRRSPKTEWRSVEASTGKHGLERFIGYIFIWNNCFDCDGLFLSMYAERLRTGLLEGRVSYKEYISDLQTSRRIRAKQLFCFKSNKEETTDWKICLLRNWAASQFSGNQQNKKQNRHDEGHHTFPHAVHLCN